MVAWIIGAHHLWERARDEGEREETFLYNASTALTLSIGVLVMSASAYVLTLLGSSPATRVWNEKTPGLGPVPGL